jgi:Class III cytochrome C family
MVTGGPNTSSLSIAALLRIALAGLSCVILFAQTDPSQPFAPAQPIPFSHKTHVSKGLKCQVCHTNPDPGEDMVFPDAAKCMACHTTIAKDKPAIQALRELAQSKQPVPWVRVYNLPVEIYWSHRPHVAAGIICDACHGRVSEMDVLARATNVTTMQGCVDCHKQHKVSTGCNFCHDDK